MKKLMKKLLKKLSKETKIKVPQQINFIGELLKNTGATMFSKKVRGNYFNFTQNSVTIV